MNPTRELRTPKCTVALDERGICWLVFDAPDIVVALEDSKAIVAARRKLGASPEAPQLLCVDLTHTPRPTKESRDYTSSPDITSITLAMAMVTTGAMGRLIGNFFLGFSRGGFPTRLFPDEAKAVEWLESRSG